MMYFIISGRVKLYSDGYPFIRYSQGDMFGDQDTLLNLPRDSKAVAMTHLDLKALSMSQFEKLSTQSQETCFRMIVDARKKRDRHLNLIAKVQQKRRQKNIVIVNESTPKDHPFDDGYQAENETPNQQMSVDGQQGNMTESAFSGKK